MPILKATAKNIKKAAAIIRAGGIVAFPTETVYGLGANAFDAKAVKKIFKAKGRPGDNPLIVHVANKRDVASVAKLGSPSTSLRSAQDILMRRFWPGPLTLVLPKAKRIPSIVSAGLPTVAVRTPSNGVARALIRASGAPIAAPSANKSGRPSPTDAQHVLHDLGDKLFILDGGRTKIGLESTVIDAVALPFAVLRHGGITLEALRKVVPDSIDAATYKKRGPAKSPGMKYRHYAPQARVILADDVLAAVKQLGSRRVCILGTRENAPRYATLKKRGMAVRMLGSRRNLAGCARRLFSELRACDTLKVDAIIVERFPKVGIGRALMERLERAAA